jgi:hypothetical protein
MTNSDPENDQLLSSLPIFQIEEVKQEIVIEPFVSAHLSHESLSDFQLKDIERQSRDFSGMESLSQQEVKRLSDCESFKLDEIDQEEKIVLEKEEKLTQKKLRERKYSILELHETEKDFCADLTGVYEAFMNDSKFVSIYNLSYYELLVKINSFNNNFFC